MRKLKLLTALFITAALFGTGASSTVSAQTTKTTFDDSRDSREFIIEMLILEGKSKKDTRFLLGGLALGGLAPDTLGLNPGEISAADLQTNVKAALKTGASLHKTSAVTINRKSTLTVGKKLHIPIGEQAGITKTTEILISGSEYNFETEPIEDAAGVVTGVNLTYKINEAVQSGKNLLDVQRTGIQSVINIPIEKYFVAAGARFSGNDKVYIFRVSELK